MKRLRKPRDTLLTREEKFLLISGDGKCISAEIVSKYHQRGVYYLLASSYSFK